MPDDKDVVLTSKYRCERVGKKLVIKDKKGGKKSKAKEKEYDSEHAAKCALGRIRFDEAMAQTIVDNINIEEIKGPIRKRHYKGRLIKSDLVAASVIDTLVSELETGDNRDKVLKGIITDAIKDAEKQTKSGDKTPTLYKLREAVSKRNSQLQAAEAKRAAKEK